MRFQKIAFLLFAILFCCVAFSACNSGSVVPQEPMRIIVNNSVYAELDQETIQKLNLAVPSCDGLTACGIINGAGKKETRRVLKSKDDRNPTVQTVTVGETAYTHPDSRYPNLVVALVSGEPAVFQYCNGGLSEGSALKEMYGIGDANKIREIQIRSQQAGQKAVLEETVTDPADLEAFCNAIDSEQGSSGRAREYNEEETFPAYIMNVELDNGFSFEFVYYPNKGSGCVYFAGETFGSSEPMNEWLNSHIK